jgi:hypothetical protein
LDSTNGRALLLRYLSLAGPQRTAPSQRGVGLARSTTHPLVLGCARARDPLRPSVGWRRSGEAAPSRGCGCPSLAEPGDDSARQQPLVVRPPGWGSTSRPHVGPLAARWVTVGGPAPMEPPTEFERGAPRAGPRGRARGRSATPSSGPPGESGLHMWVSGPKPHLRGVLPRVKACTARTRRRAMVLHSEGLVGRHTFVPYSIPLEHTRSGQTSSRGPRSSPTGNSSSGPRPRRGPTQRTPSLAPPPTSRRRVGAGGCEPTGADTYSGSPLRRRHLPADGPWVSPPSLRHSWLRRVRRERHPRVPPRHHLRPLAPET